MLQAMDLRQVRKALRPVVRSAALTVRRGVQQEVKAEFGTGAQGGYTRVKGYGRVKAVSVRGELHAARPLYKDVKMFTYKRETLGANVSILDSRRWNRAYILRFQNQGTKERRTEEGYSRGRLTARHFFEEGSAKGGRKAGRELRAKADAALVKAWLKYKPEGGTP